MSTFSYLPGPPPGRPTPLLIRDDERRALRAIRDRAITQPVDVRTLRDRIATSYGLRQHHAQMRRQTTRLPMDFTVTFSVEVGHPGGTARHMSMSSRAGRVVTPAAAEMVAEELGYDLPLLGSARVWFEDLKGNGKAINIVQLVRASGEGHA